MPAETTQTAPVAAEARHHIAFFRQSGWLMIANVGSGAMMYAVHLLNKKIPPEQYGIFGVLLAVAMFVPNLPLQMVFAQQTAQALAMDRRRELAGMIRLAWLGTFALCLLLGIGTFIWQKDILTGWQINNPADLWITVLVVLFSFWLPMFWGVLQGQQDFLWLGWSNILNGVGRLGVASFLVLALGAYAGGMMLGVLLGLVVGVGIAVWQTRSLWSLSAQPFDWRSLLKQITPLMLGFGAVQFLFTADTMFVKAYFSGDDAAFYVSAGTLSRALMWLVVPLATVMFPKIVHSVARSEKSNLLGMVLLGTGLLAAGGALGLTILGPWIIRLIYSKDYVSVAAAVLPWYAWAMVPLSLAYALINNLLARSQFRIVPVLLLLAVAYGVALTRFHDTQITVLKTLGVFNLLLLGASTWFTLRSPKPEPEARA
ncbi:MAG TPA: lipid II flippase MurJ [Verrucomicrobiae bacterium]|nr:lipid II flippase MurJ [Verrucomicrobiae bacterium]